MELIEVPSGAEPIYVGDLDGDGPDDMTRAEWLELRRGGIGGSDASAICGVNKYQSPFAVWLQKAGRQAGFALPEDRDNKAMAWGRRLEDPVAQAFAEELKTTIVNPRAMYWDRSGPFPRYANPDRLCWDHELGSYVPLEVKTCTVYLADDWGEDTPAAHAYVQGTHYADVMGYDYFWAAVLIGGQEDRYMRVKVDRDFAANIQAVEERFWRDHVEALAPPTPDGSDASLIGELYAAVYGATTELPPEAEDLWADYMGAHAAEKEAKAIKEDRGAKLKFLLGRAGANIGRLEGRKLCTWGEPFTKRSVPAENLDRMKRTHPDLYAEYVVEKLQRRLTVHPEWAATPDQ